MVKSTLDDIFIGVVFHWLIPNLSHTEVFYSKSVVENRKLDHHLGKKVNATEAEKPPLNSINHLPLFRSIHLITLFLLCSFIFISLFLNLFHLVFFLFHFFLKLSNFTLKFDIVA